VVYFKSKLEIHFGDKVQKLIHHLSPSVGIDSLL